MIIPAILLAAQIASASGGQPCRLSGGEAVPTPQVARELAGAILRGRQTVEESALYELSVEPAGKDAWDVIQSMKPRTHPNGVVDVMSGGLLIRIARCDGQIRLIQPFI